MRPLELVVEGLRSYVTRQEIDFRDTDLMAIIGDTGAGKSSILEAICFALYGGSTWNARSVKELISHGADVMKVRLRFLADGHEWEVERTACRGSSPRPVIKLVCEELGVKLDGRNDVTPRIQELVGLDFNAFLGAVILPQGRFQDLLKATPADRTRILKGIFRLDALERMRRWAEEWLDERRPQLETLRVDRAGLHGDPRAEADRAQERMDELDQRAGLLEQARLEVARADEQARALAQQIQAMDHARQDVADFSLNAIGDGLARLVVAEQALQAQRLAVDGEIATLGDDHRAVCDALKKRERGGLGMEGLTAAAGTLQRLLELGEDVSAADTRRAAMQSEMSELDEDSRALAESRARAQQGYSEAQRGLEAARRDDAAAHLAAHLAPGDTCPVCRQGIPVSFVVPDRSGTRLGNAESALERARRELDGARDAEAGVVRKLERKRIEVEQIRKDRERAHKQMGELMAALPGALRPDNVGRDSVQEVAGRVDERKRALNADSDRRAVLAQALEAARHKRAALDQRLTQEVSLPARDVRNQIMQCAKALSALQRLLIGDQERSAQERSIAQEESMQPLPMEPLPIEPLPMEPLSSDADLAAMGAYADRLRAVVGAVLGRAGERLKAAWDRRHTFAAQASARLRDVDCDSLAELDTRIGATRAERQRAASDHERARAQIERARDLDARIGKASALVEQVDELRKLLADGKFVSYAVERKQQAMLSVASTLLSDMTGGRFGFAPDFQIVDKRAGEARSTDTLSGGETFLASLALALALVELATRSGGRLDALFLDEGFAALDADALEQAIQALMSQAERGRLVVVISHLQAVAENIDRVLHVMSSPTGSKAHPVAPHERGHLDTEYTGLLA